MRILFILATLLLTPVVHAQSAQNGPVDITADQLDVEQAKGVATFTGNVLVKQQGFTLTAPKIVASYAKSGGDIESIEATGGVVITRVGQGGITEKASGTTATYAPTKQQVTMAGAVTLIRGPSQLSGDRLVYDMATGNARVTNSKGPVKARFVPGAK